MLVIVKLQYVWYHCYDQFVFIVHVRCEIYKLYYYSFSTANECFAPVGATVAINVMPKSDTAMTQSATHSCILGYSLVSDHDAVMVECHWI